MQWFVVQDANQCNGRLMSRMPEGAANGRYVILYATTAPFQWMRNLSGA